MRAGPANDTECPLTAALDLLGRVWMLETIRQLLEGPRHFVDLREATGCPSPSTFTRRLRVLESEGLVARRVLSRTPPSVEYELTEMGLDLASALEEVAIWAERWLLPPVGGNGSKPNRADTSNSRPSLEPA
jgi:DNA-binding HxlR family transcriptional regulator